MCVATHTANRRLINIEHILKKTHSPNTDRIQTVHSFKQSCL